MKRPESSITLREWALLGILAFCAGCGAPEPEKPACPALFPGTETFACNQGRITGIALGNDDVVWANRTGNSTMNEEASIMRQSKAGGEAVVLASGRPYAFDVVLDSEFVYWLEADLSASLFQIMKMPLAGGEPTLVFTGLPNLRQFFVDNGDIYMVVGDSDLGGYGISRLPAGSSTAEPLVENWPAGFFSVVPDGADVFFATTAKEIWRVPKTGGAPSVVAGGLVEPLFMTTYASTIYVTDRSGGTVSSVDEKSGATTKLAETDWLAAEIAVDETNAYWFEFTFNSPPGEPIPAAFRTVSRTGGTATTLGEFEGNDLRIDSTHLYFTVGKNIVRYTK